MSHLKNVAVVGATGRIGKFITDALLAGGKHTLTAITRGNSSDSLPPQVITKTVDYASHASLVSALRGQDALIITMGARAPRDQQTKLIEAAAEAGVPWVLPNAWGSDTDHPSILRNPLNAGKTAYTDQIEKLGKSSWISVVNNQWWEWSLGGGFYGIDIPSRTAKFWGNGDSKTLTTTWPRVGEAVAKLLALPVTGASPCLEDFRNRHVYVYSFYVSQRDMLDAVQAHTGTTDKDWTFSSEEVVPAYENALEEFQKGNFSAALTLIYGGNFMPAGGNDYHLTKTTLNEILGLSKEDIHEATGHAIEYSKVHKPAY